MRCKLRKSASDFVEQLESRLLMAASQTLTDDHSSVFQNATVVQISTTGQGSVGGTINYSGDVDLMTFRAVGTGVASVRMTGSSLTTPLLGIYDSQQTQLTSTSGTSTLTVSFNVYADQKYYIRAASTSTRAKTATGTYSISINSPQFEIDPITFLPNATAFSSLDSGLSTSTRTYVSSKGSILVILGTENADNIIISTDSSGQIVLNTSAISGSYAGLAVYGFGGNDTIRLTNTVSLPDVIYAGGGDDTIFNAGMGFGHVYGQDGNDSIVTVGGYKDVVSGGNDYDNFWVDSTDLIADSSAQEVSGRAIRQISQFVQPLGNVVPLEIAGQNIFDPITSASYADFSSKPIFNDGPQYNDIRQGGVGDCYFMAALSAMAKNNPDMIRQTISPLGDGTYVVRFYQSALTPCYIRLDTQLPSTNGTPDYAQLTPTGELWVAMLEKAWALFRYYGSSNYTATYNSINSGWASEGYLAVSGNSASTYMFSGVTEDAAGTYISSLLASNYSVSACSFSSATAPVVGSHVYAVTGIQKDASGAWMVTVYNPWGWDGRTWDSNSGDGLLTIPMSVFLANYSYIQSVLV